MARSPGHNRSDKHCLPDRSGDRSKDNRHGVNNITVAFDTLTNVSMVPAEFDKARGIIIVVIADVIGAVTLDSVVAGELILLEQPQELTLEM